MVHKKSSSSSNKPTSSNKPPSSGSKPTKTYEDGLPRSVRHAPPELRETIRRRQSTESARRRRERDTAEMEDMERKYSANDKRIEDLERTIDKLSSELHGHK